MKLLRYLSILLLAAAPALAQRSTATATIAPYAGGTVTATFQRQGGGAPSVQRVSGAINGSGVFSLAVWDNRYSGYAPSLTQFNICAAAPYQTTCYSNTAAVTGATDNVSSIFSSAPSPPSSGGSGPCTGTSTTEIGCTTTDSIALYSGLGLRLHDMDTVNGGITIYEDGTKPIQLTALTGGIGSDSQGGTYLADNNADNGFEIQESSTGGTLQLTTNSQQVNLVDGAAIEIQNLGVGNISVDSAGGISIYDTGVHGTGIVIQEQGAGLPVNILTDVPADAQANGSQICTFVNPCPSGTVSNSITSATGGSGTGTVTCATASCTNLRGSYTVAGGTFATGTLLALVWPTTTTAYVCSASVLNNATGASIGYHSVATATGMNITSLTAVTGLSVDIDYSCTP